MLGLNKRNILLCNYKLYIKLVIETIFIFKSHLSEGGMLSTWNSLIQIVGIVMGS